MAEVVDAEEQKKKNKEKKSHRKAIAFWISFLLILSLLSGVYYGGYKYCETHFMPGSTINGFDCSGLTEEEAEKRFADAADKYTLNIHFRGGSTEVLTAQDIGFAYKPDGSIGAMIYGQDRTLWPRYLFEDYAYTLELGGSCDPDLLTSALSALPELQEENMQKPQDAYIQFMDGNETEDGSFQVIPDNPGNTIDLVQLAAGAGDAAARYEQDIDAEKIAARSAREKELAEKHARTEKLKAEGKTEVNTNTSKKKLQQQNKQSNEERRKAAERAEREERRARLGIEIEKNDSQVGDRRFARGRAYEADRFKDKKQDADNNN